MKKMLHCLVVSCLLSGSLPALAEESVSESGPQAAEESDGWGITLRPRVGYGLSDYTLELDGFTAGEVNSEYKPLTFGASLISDLFFLDVTYSNGSGDTDLFSFRLERDELIANIGMRLGAFSIYFGYLDAQSEFEPDGADAASFESSGFLTGFGLGVPAFGGSFSLGAGLAFLEGKFTETDGSSFDADYTVGYSGSVGYGYPISSHINIRGDVKYNAYSFDFESSIGGTADESVVSYLLSLAYAF